MFEDFGYSNYTVEGTSFSCAKRAHPDGTFDRFYGEDARLRHAEKCDAFEEGEAASVDCERESLKDGTLTAEQLGIYQTHLDAPQ